MLESSEGDGQMFEAAKGNTGCMFRFLARHLWLVEAPQQGAEGDFSFESGQGRAQAEMGSVAKGEMPVFWAAEVELIWIVELRGVTIGRAQAE